MLSQAAAKGTFAFAGPLLKGFRASCSPPGLYCYFLRFLVSDPAISLSVVGIRSGGRYVEEDDDAESSPSTPNIILPTEYAVVADSEPTQAPGPTAYSYFQNYAVGDYSAVTDLPGNPGESATEMQRSELWWFDCGFIHFYRCALLNLVCAVSGTTRINRLFR